MHGKRGTGGGVSPHAVVVFEVTLGAYSPSWTAAMSRQYRDRNAT
jgi:hypothetical protein